MSESFTKFFHGVQEAVLARHGRAANNWHLTLEALQVLHARVVALESVQAKPTCPKCGAVLVDGWCLVDGRAEHD